MFYGLGIDISKDKFDACISKKMEGNSIKVVATRKFPNTISGFKSLTNWLRAKAKGETINQVVMEPTGIYHENLAYFLRDQNYNVCIVMAKQAKYYLKSLGYKSKTDKIDAKGLAQMSCERKIEKWEPPSKDIRNLRSVCRLKDSLERDKSQIPNRLHAMINSYNPDAFAVKELKKAIKSIENRITRVENEIEARLSIDSEFNVKVHKIAESIKGVGVQTVATIATELLGFNTFSSQSQVVSYCGYDVRIVQSGKHTGQKRISKQGNSRVRKALYFPAITAVTHDKENGIFKNLFNRVYYRSSFKMKGYVAVQRKLLTIIYTLWKNNSEFDENYQNKYPKSKNEISGIVEQKSSFSKLKVAS